MQEYVWLGGLYNAWITTGEMIQKPSSFLDNVNVIEETVISTNSCAVLKLGNLLLGGWTLIHMNCMNCSNRYTHTLWEKKTYFKNFVQTVISGLFFLRHIREYFAHTFKRLRNISLCMEPIRPIRERSLLLSTCCETEP